MAQFPRARGSETEPKAKDPMMKRVNMEHGEIGSRSSGMPRSMDNETMSISHVGTSDKQGS